MVLAFAQKITTLPFHSSSITGSSPLFFSYTNLLSVIFYLYFCSYERYFRKGNTNNLAKVNTGLYV